MLFMGVLYRLIRLKKTPVGKDCQISCQGPVARSLVSANRWLRGIKMYRFPWYLTLVSTNHASSNPGQGRHGAFIFTERDPDLSRPLGNPLFTST